MRITEAGETGLIERIRKIVENNSGKKPVRGIGDDTAVVKFGGKLLLLTTDTLVENVHFDRRIMNGGQIGWKAMVSNVSDIAAMGGIPEYCLVSLAIPENACVQLVDNLYKGLRRAAIEYGVGIIGGDTVRCPRNLTITLTLTGKTCSDIPVYRHCAKAGDKLLVTGTFGDSAAGLEILKKSTGSNYRSLLKRHREPTARLRESNIIARRGFATSMMDSSDGLDVSVNTICGMSGVGARVFVDKVPVSPQLERFAGRNSLRYSIYGGEDYELVFTAKPARVKDIIKAVPGVSVIGDIVNKPGVKYMKEGKEVKVRGTSFRHFKKA